ncbi:MAG: DNA gyrase subunit A [Archaeoglobaceae archaeon]|nr:DNA gyrase subunit A [Archaeoglobaceae archaeon]MDW7989666.1 DNA gyrase subunit A [Archaeoglobaceae archaeon]
MENRFKSSHREFLVEIIRDIGEELRSSYIDYAMSVIVGRALPDVRDGLKPVQRRILYAMYEMGLKSDKNFRKCARIVGEVLGKYHPHGDAAVYETLVRLAQDFTMRYPLIEGQGNFGSIDGDSPAAMRYTEARLTKIAEEMLADIDKNTVDFMSNFDSTLKEPVVLPSRIPNLLINGSSGIAVGMTTNIPPHNLSEVCDAIVYCIENPNATLDDVMRFIEGPDFPTGGEIIGKDGIIEAYRTGKGKITVRGTVEVEKDRIVIKEVPYMVNKARLIESIAELVKEGKLDEVKTIRDESDREGIRIVIEVKSSTNTALRKLYNHTNLETTFGINLLALYNNEPKIMNLLELISYFIEHRREVTKRKIKYELEKAKERLHIIEGLKKVIEDLDNAIKTIRVSKSPLEAKKALMDIFNLSESQAEFVLQTKLQKFTSTERQALIDEHSNLTKFVREMEEILAEPRKVNEILIREIREIKERYSDPRRTRIIQKTVDFIEIEENLLLITSNGFAKRMEIDVFRKQERGGVGILAIHMNEGDEIVVFGTCRSDEKILIFTDSGRVFCIDAEEIPKMDRSTNGVSLKKIIRIEDEKIVSAFGIKNFENSYIVILTETGHIKRVPIEDFENAKRAGILASTERISFVDILKGRDIFIVTRNGYVLRLDSEKIPIYSRNSRGVFAITLREGDSIAYLTSGKRKNILILSERGYGKRCDVSEFRVMNRGAMGISGYKVSEKSGKIALAEVCDEGEVFLISSDGYCIRLNLEDIPIQRRNSSGVMVSKKGVKRGFIYSKNSSILLA